MNQKQQQWVLFRCAVLHELIFDEVPPEAQELLRPNAIFSRRFQRPGEIGVHVLVVHCSDARDMIGHYPPICYPSSGWVSTITGNRPTSSSATWP